MEESELTTFMPYYSFLPRSLCFLWSRIKRPNLRLCSLGLSVTLTYFSSTMHLFTVFCCCCCCRRCRCCCSSSCFCIARLWFIISVVKCYESGCYVFLPIWIGFLQRNKRQPKNIQQ